VLLGLYSFTLPHTPPPSAGKKVTARELLGVDAFVLLKKPSFAIFMASSFLICIPLAFYYQLAAKSLQQTGVAGVATKMSYGQISEILFMVLMPLFFKKLGVKWMLLVGMAAWVLRYGLFAVAAPGPDPIIWMMILGIVLHGICYDFFFVTGQIYTDKTAPSAIRGQAQGMLVLFTLGIGMFIGAQAAGFVEEQLASPPEAKALNDEVKELDAKIKTQRTELNSLLAEAGEESRAEFEAWQADIGKVQGIRKTAQTTIEDIKKLGVEETGEFQLGNATWTELVLKKDADLPAAERLALIETILDKQAPESLEKPLVTQLQIDEMAAEQGTKSDARLKLLDWQTIWLIPCAMAGVVMLLFAALFRDDAKPTITEDDATKAFTHNIPENPNERHSGNA
jgi:hypothetical protein